MLRRQFRLKPRRMLMHQLKLKRQLMRMRQLKPKPLLTVTHQWFKMRLMMLRIPRRL